MPNPPSSQPSAIGYSGSARAFHWVTFALVALLFPVGLIMTSLPDSYEKLGNVLYSGHKLFGFILLWIVLARLAYRLFHRPPADEPSLEPWQKLVSHATHWVLYGMLVLVPMLGWLGASRYPSLDLFGPLRLPAIASASQAEGEKLFAWHGLAAKVLVIIACAHIGAALYHYFIRKDGVLQRMWPSATPRDN